MKMGIGRRIVRFLEERRVRLPGLLYADDLIMCGESEEGLRAMVRRFFEVCRRGMKVIAGKSKVHVDGIRLEHVSEFKYFGCVLVESGTDGENVVGRWRVGGGLQMSLGS